jgi:hypothetical protein
MSEENQAEIPTEERGPQFYGQHRSKEDGPWAWFNHDAMQRALEIEGGPGVAVYATLCLLESKALPRHKRNFAVSHKEIACLSGFSVSKVQRVIATLCEKRLVEKVSGRRRVSGVANVPNFYRILHRWKKGGASVHGTEPLMSGVPNPSVQKEGSIVPTRKDSFPLPKGKGGKERGDKNKQKGGEAAPLTPLASDGQRVAGASAKETEPTAAIPMATTQSPPAHSPFSHWHKLTADTLAEKSRQRSTIEFLTPQDESEHDHSGQG